MATRLEILFQARFLVTGVCVAIVAAFALVSVVAGDAGQSDHVAAGVQALNRNFSNLKSSELPGAVKIAFTEYANRPFRLRYSDVDLTLTPSDLALSLESEATAQRILDAGRQDTFLDRLGRLIGREPKRAVAPVMAVDDDRLASTVQKLAASIDQPARNAGLQISSLGIKLQPASNGRKLDVPLTVAKLREHLMQAELSDVPAVVNEVVPTIRDADVQEATQRAAKIIGAPVVIRQATRTWQLEANDMASLLALDPPIDGGQDAGLRWNDAGLAAFVTSIARELDVKPVDARVERKDGAFAVVPGTDGSKVDITATVTAIKKAAEGTSRDVAVPIVTALPAAVASDWQDAIAVANRAVSAPLKLAFQDQAWNITQADLSASLTFTKTQEGQPRYVVALDSEQVKGILGKVAKQLNRPPLEPRLRLRDGKVTLVANGKDGRTLDIESAASQIARQVFQDDRNVPLLVTVTKPNLILADLAKLSFPDMIIDAATSYAGSIPERAHNVELASSRLDGTLVPPGGTFSFNESVGMTTLAAGYQIGYGITIQNGEAVTVPAEAGGICQVATTIFQAAFWAGYPIVERQSHIYWISRYEARGFKGLDATVDDPYLDFKFKNNTADWLLVETSTDGADLHFVLRGKKPDWQVKVDRPVITDVVRASQDAVKQDDPTMPKGWELSVEHAEDGFSSQIRRTVMRGSDVLAVSTVVSNYRPARNVLLVGTKGVTPTPSASLTPTAGPSSATPLPSTIPSVTTTPLAKTPTPTPR